jgi:3-dehydroquinate dehydratase II
VKVLVLNGPNLARLGTREPEIYGAATYAELVTLCQRSGTELGLEVDVRQTDSEPDMLSWLHEAADTATPVVLNAAAWSHYSIAVRDAAAQLTAPLVRCTSATCTPASRSASTATCPRSPPG